MTSLMEEMFSEMVSGMDKLSEEFRDLKDQTSSHIASLSRGTVNFVMRTVSGYCSKEAAVLLDC